MQQIIVLSNLETSTASDLKNGGGKVDDVDERPSRKSVSGLRDSKWLNY